MKYDSVIGILTYARADFLEDCLVSILNTVSDLDRNVIVIANNSEDPDYITSVEKLASLHPEARITTMHFRRNRGTSAAWNAIARSYDCKNVVIANDDIIVHSLWREAMMQVFAMNPSVGCFSFHQKNGKEEWGFRNTSPLPWNLSFQEVTYPPGSFLMFKRSRFDEVGGFSEQSWIGLEEVQFSIDLMKRGYTNYQVGDSDWKYFFVNHYGSGTEYYPKDAAPELRKQAKLNIESFQEKYGTKWPLSPEYEQELRVERDQVAKERGFIR